MRRYGVVLLMLAAVAMTFLGCAKEAPANDVPADSSINAENTQYWREVHQKYRTDPKVSEIMLVRYTGGCFALDEERMVEVLRHANPGMRVVIGRD